MKKLMVVSACGLSAASVMAATDMAEVVTTVAGYWDAVSVVAIGILLFVVGRRVVRKL